MTVGPCWSSVASPRSTGARRAGASRRWRTSPSRSSRPSWPSWSARSAPASRPCSASSPVRSARRGAPCWWTGREVGTLGARPGAAAPEPRGLLPDGQLLPDRTALGNLTFVLRALGAGRAEARRPRPRHAWSRSGSARRGTRFPSELAVRGTPAACCSPAPWRPARGSCSPTSPRRCSTRRRPRWWGRSCGACRSEATTCLVATQSIELARALDGRVLQLAAGRLRPEGDPV